MGIFNLIKNITKAFNTVEDTPQKDSPSGKYRIGFDDENGSDYELEWNETDEGQGFVVKRISDGQRLQWRTLARTEGLEAVPIVGVSYRKKALQDSSFAPGKPLEIIPEPENPHDPNAVGVWNQEKTLQVGYLPREYSDRIARQGILIGTEKIGCMSMWEHLDGKKRVGLRVLMVLERAKIKGLYFK